MTNKTPPILPIIQPPPASCPYAHFYPPRQEDEIGLHGYWRAMTDHKKMIAVITGISTTIALITAFVLTPIYRAEVLLSPTISEKAGGLGAVAGQFGDLAALAGINLGGGAADPTQEAAATLKSRALTDAFFKEKNLLPILFEDDWSSEKKAWKDQDPKDIPTLWKAYKLFDEYIRRVSIDKKTGLVTLSIEWKDPVQAADWANELVKRVNRQRQFEAIQEAESSIHYLYEQLAKTNSVEVQQAIYRLIEAQMKSATVAKSRQEYAFKVIDPAVAPEKKIKPKRAVIVIFGFVGGLVLAMLCVLANQRMQLNSKPAP